MSNRYSKSEQLLDRALGVIPLGSQVFSKSFTHIPRYASPFFAERGSGGRFTDVDGNTYIDLCSGLLSLILGYRFPEVEQSVRRQLDKGILFSVGHPLEIQVAERIIDIVPSAEMVRFCKNASDATTAAIRLARHITGRDRIAICGYHGWHDWSIGTTSRSQGVPGVVRSLSHRFSFNSLESLEKLFEAYPMEFAGVILEPMSREWPKPGFLSGLKDLTHKHGAIFIFDETITGFRFAKGGAQELFDVKPDLTIFGKGLANGYPLSALVGSRDLMREVAQIFFSSTFGGETVSLAAAASVLDVIIEKSVVGRLAEIGTVIAEEVNRQLTNSALDNILNLEGHPSWKIWNIYDHPLGSSYEIKTFLLQELNSRGVFSIGSHNVNFSHTAQDVSEVSMVYQEVLSTLAEVIQNGDRVCDHLQGPALEPLFSVR